MTSLTGEKLYESQVIAAVQAACRALGVHVLFYVLVAVDRPAGYCLLVEYAAAAAAISPDTMARVVDQSLAEQNLEYHGKRDSGRLSPLAVTRLPAGAADVYRAAAVRRRQREGQLKPPALQYQRDLFDEFHAYLPLARPS